MWKSGRANVNICVNYPHFPQLCTANLWKSHPKRRLALRERKKVIHRLGALAGPYSASSFQSWRLTETILETPCSSMETP